MSDADTHLCSGECCDVCHCEGIRLPMKRLVRVTEMQAGDRVRWFGVSIAIMRDAEDCLDLFGRTEMRYWVKREDTDEEGYVHCGLSAVLDLERLP